MAESVRRVGLMGGTFDPIHNGHLVTAEEARVQFHLDEVIFIPSGRPPHKNERKVASAHHRLMMTLLATVTNPHFQVSQVEVDRPGYSYTYDTVSYFQDLYLGKAELYFITGADAILEIIAWKDVEKLFEKCSFIAATRPGFDLSTLEHSGLPKMAKDKIFFMEIPALAISSTDVRERVKTGRPIKYLMPSAVATYIYKNHLYFNGNKKFEGLN